MAWVMHVRGYCYDQPCYDRPSSPAGRGAEHVHDCYLTRDGQACRLFAQARRYASEAEAWDHLVMSGCVDGEDLANGCVDEEGPVAWPEEVP